MCKGDLNPWAPGQFETFTIRVASDDAAWATEDSVDRIELDLRRWLSSIEKDRPWYVVATYADGVTYLALRQDAKAGRVLSTFPPTAAGVLVDLGGSAHLGLEVSASSRPDVFITFGRLSVRAAVHRGDIDTPCT